MPSSRRKCLLIPLIPMAIFGIPYPVRTFNPESHPYFALKDPDSWPSSKANPKKPIVDPYMSYILSPGSVPSLLCYLLLPIWSSQRSMIVFRCF